VSSQLRPFAAQCPFNRDFPPSARFANFCHFAQIGSTNQTWVDKLRGDDETQLCSLQGCGQLSAQWSTPRELMVVCTSCDQKQFYTNQTSWNGVAIRFASQN
jgi:hypothetical protein